MGRNKIPTFEFMSSFRGSTIIRCLEQGLFYNDKQPNPDKNVLELYIDDDLWAHGNVKKVQFFNYKIISRKLTATSMVWQSEIIEKKDNGYQLTIFGANDEMFSITFEKMKQMN